MIHKTLVNVSFVFYILAVLLILACVFLVMDGKTALGLSVAAAGVGSVVTGMILHAIGQIGQDLQASTEYLRHLAYGDEEDAEDDEPDGEDAPDPDK